MGKNVQSTSFREYLKVLINNKSNYFTDSLKLSLDEDGLIRCGSRLENAELSYSAIFPKSLPKNHYYTKLVVENVHQRLVHSGVSQTLAQIRNEYWILHGRTIIKGVLNRCLICRKVEGGAFPLPPMPQLSEARVNAPAFVNVGVDFFGPLYVKLNNSSKKSWVCLFTCMVVQAVHLELVEDLTTQEFLLALRRFVARRGKPNLLLSDNAPQFNLSKLVVQTLWRKFPYDAAV